MWHLHLVSIDHQEVLVRQRVCVAANQLLEMRSRVVLVREVVHRRLPHFLPSCLFVGLGPRTADVRRLEVTPGHDVGMRRANRWGPAGVGGPS